MIDANLPAVPKKFLVGFIAADTTQAKILVDVQAPQVMAAVAGEVALPGESAVRQRVLLGGVRLIDGNISSTDGTARAVSIIEGTQFSVFANMGVPTITTQNAINRTAGSFITDGWRVGDLVYPFNMLTGANNGAVGVVTVVASGTLTVNGTPWTNETMPAGSRLVRGAIRTNKVVAISAGTLTAATTPSVPLFGGTQDPASAALPDTGMSLGPNDVLLCAMAATISALPASVQVVATGLLL